MNKFDLYFYFIVNDKNHYLDNGKRSLFFDAKVFVNKVPYEVSILTDENNFEMIRIKKEGLIHEELSLQEKGEITYLKEMVLNSINLHLAPSARIRFTVHQFIPHGEKPDLNITLNKGKPLNQCIKDFGEFFVSSLDKGNGFKLIADARKTFIPIQFRFLSLYKFLELEFKKNGKWGNHFFNFLNSISSEFEKRNISTKKLKNYIHIIRDKCAHVKSNNDVLGVTSLSYEDEEEVKAMTAFLLFACIEYVNQVKLKESKIKHLPTNGFDLN